MLVHETSYILCHCQVIVSGVVWRSTMISKILEGQLLLVLYILLLH